jgi:hypothetical protein
MAEYSDNMLQCIREIDHELAMKLWKHVRPWAAQPENDLQAIIMLHYSRTQIASMPEALRLYSHCFLRDHGMPSALPDHLKPKAERLYPVGTRSVGVSSGKAGGSKTSFNFAVQKVMSDAVLETYADGHIDNPRKVKSRILEMRARFKKQA